MASHGVAPSLDLAAAKSILREDLPRALDYYGAANPEELGWKVIDDRTLVVPIVGSHEGKQDTFTLRLSFKTGRDWPPSAQFVNPETLDYDAASDQHHLPNLATSEVHVHARYECPNKTFIQLICCSATLEYYEVLHGGQDHIVWRERDTFLVTINAIQRAMAQKYGGRLPHAA